MSKEDDLKMPTKGKMFKYLLVACAIMLIISIVGGIFNTAGKVLSTPGRVLDKTLETNNVIQSYEWFFDTDAAYTARLDQVRQYSAMYNSETDKNERINLRTEMAAMQQTCRNLATKYNANSEKMNKGIFKGWDLPATLSYKNCN